MTGRAGSCGRCCVGPVSSQLCTAPADPACAAPGLLLLLRLRLRLLLQRLVLLRWRLLVAMVVVLMVMMMVQRHMRAH